MKIRIFFIGKPRDTHLNALAADYVSRINHYGSIEQTEVRRLEANERKRAAFRIALDPLGRTINSHEFAKILERAEMSGQELHVFVGGAEGLPPEWRADANLLLSLSTMTFPHELARVMVLEQIYRGFALLRGHPYPR